MRFLHSAVNRSLAQSVAEWTPWLWQLLACRGHIYASSIDRTTCWDASAKLLVESVFSVFNENRSIWGLLEKRLRGAFFAEY